MTSTTTKIVRKKRPTHIQAAVIFALLVVAAAVTKPLWFGVMHFGHSAHIDLIRQIEVNQAYNDGYVYPRWIADFYFGRGSPIFNFYAPFVYLVGAWLGFFGVPALWAVKCVYAACVALAGIGMFLLVRELWGTASAAAASILYMLSPYLLVDLYVRSALGELSAFGWLPLAMYFILRAAHTARTFHAARAASAVALLCVSHNIGALLGVPVLMAWTLAVGQRASARKLWTALALGIAASAFFWAPALLEKSSLSVEANLIAGDYHFSRHFVSLARLVDPTWGFGSPMKAGGDIMSTQVGRLHLLLLAPGLAYLVFGPRRWTSSRRASAAFVVIALGALLFTNRVTEPIWNALPLLPFVQFPFRFLVPASIGLAALAGTAVWFAHRRFGRYGGWAMSIALIASSAVAYGPYVEARYLFHDRADPNRMVVVDRRAADVLRRQPHVVQAQELLTPRVLREERESKSTALDDYLPATVKAKPTGPAAQLVEVASGEAHVTVVESRDAYYRMRIDAPRGATLLAHVFDFPGWTARAGRRALVTRTHETSGEILIEVPAGTREVTLTFEDTQTRLLAKFASALAVGILIFWIGVEQYRSVQGPPRADRPPLMERARTRFRRRRKRRGG
ncbi:MAG: hypothetical protein KJ042_01035 [Deltaproteobacteria bacterium]|nr:hypothetical protein [Deltaproteobacteria bacterium]